MKRHREITVSSVELNAAGLARYVEKFADSTENWAFPLDRSRAYERACGEPSCCVVIKVPGLEHAAISLAKSGPRTLRATNIVPLLVDTLSVDQYNAIAVQFAAALRIYAKFDKKQIRVSLSKGNITLGDVVTGKIPGKLFSQYLNAYPMSGHPLDVGRLDKFICSIARFSRKPFDLHAFECLLIEELGWPMSEAKKCRFRVEIGLEVIDTYKKF